MYPNSYNYYPQSQNPYLNRYMPTNQYTQQLQGLKGRPVSSLEEVRATGIDIEGLITEGLAYDFSPEFLKYYYKIDE